MEPVEPSEGFRWFVGVLAVVALHGCSCTPDLNNPPNKDNTTSSTDSTPPPTDSGPPPLCAVPEIEPNDSVSEATSLPLELLGCGVIAEPGDIDVFETEVVEEGWISVNAIARSIGSFANVQFVLEPPDGSAAIRTDDEGTTDASLLFPGTPGTWSVQIAEQNFTGGDQYTYRVAVSSAKAPLEWTLAEVEPNELLANATVVTSGASVFGDMDQNLDGDWFRIDVPPGKHTLTVEVIAYAEGSAGDFNLYLSDAAQNLLPLGCDPATTCVTRGHPIDPALHDPILEWESEGNEQLFVKVVEENFRWGKHTWYVASFSLVGP